VKASTVNNAHGHPFDRQMIQNPIIGTLVYIVLLTLALAWVPLPLWAADPDTPTPTLTRDGMSEPTATLPTNTTVVPLTTPTPVPTPTAGESRTSHTPLATNPPEQNTPMPTAAPMAVPTSTALPGTAHLAVLISESAVPVGGTASSEVFVHLEDVHPGIVRLRLVLRFDPQIVHVQDQAEANGTQIALSTFFEGTQTAIENQADNTRGEIALTLVQTAGTPVTETASWQKVATIVWMGRQAGNSALTIGGQSHFTNSDGQAHPANALHHGTAFARLPGQIRGHVWLQGRSEHGNTRISGSLAATHVDRSYTAQDGSFVLTASHGEGFYTLSASAPGYLTATSSRPIKLTVGSEVALEPVTLLGGDVNGDSSINIRDLSYVAYHLDEPDVQSDLNGDGRVDILDLTLIAGNFGTVGPTTWPISD
jgi:hypothetical protein